MRIEIRNLSKYYGTQQALKNVNIELKENEVLGLLGPNGAGKSTFMKILTGVIAQDGGSFLIKQNGEEIAFSDFKNRFGYLPENNPLYGNMYVNEYLHFVADMRGLPEAKVEEVIQKVGLERERTKKIENLSKGYKQRVGIAQAIIHEPDLLILDEPTNGLDPNQILEIRNVVKKIGENKTIIISTHLMQEVEALCTRVALLDRGVLVADKNIDEFKGKHRNIEEAFHQRTGL